MSRLAFIVLCFILSAHVVAQESAPTKVLLDMCEDKENDMKQGICFGSFTTYIASEVLFQVAYMAGAIDVYNSAGLDLGDDQRQKLIELSDKRMAEENGCVGGKEPEQLIAVFVKWAKENPERWHQPGIVSINDAFREKLSPPCD